MLTARASAAVLPRVEVGEQPRRSGGGGEPVLPSPGARARPRSRCGRLVVLVANVADQLLEQILERHEADGACRASSRTIARCRRSRSMREQQLVARRLRTSANATGRSDGDVGRRRP